MLDTFDGDMYEEEEVGEKCVFKYAKDVSCFSTS